jgi:uncharacterized OB-fold protein
MPRSELLSADHSLAFPGGYTRSVGPVIGRFLTELRDGRLVGVRTAAGGVLFPPVEYDPDGEPVTGEFVDVGPECVVGTYAWVSRPRPDHPLDRPFAWALVTPDGADTAMLHVLDLGVFEAGAKQPKTLRTGLRVRPKWRAERTGTINDIESFRPDVTMINAPVRADYRLSAGHALSRFLGGVAEGRILGHRCGICGKVYVPMKGMCVPGHAGGVPHVRLDDGGGAVAGQQGLRVRPYDRVGRRSAMVCSARRRLPRRGLG